MANNPIDQFRITEIVPIEVGGLNLSFTNSALFMVVTTALVATFLILWPAHEERQQRPIKLMIQKL